MLLAPPLMGVSPRRLAARPQAPQCLGRDQSGAGRPRRGAAAPAGHRRWRCGGRHDWDKDRAGLSAGRQVRRCHPEDRQDRGSEYLRWSLVCPGFAGLGLPTEHRQGLWRAQVPIGQGPRPCTTPMDARDASNEPFDLATALWRRRYSKTTAPQPCCLFSTSLWRNCCRFGTPIRSFAGKTAYQTSILTQAACERYTSETVYQELG